MALSFTNIARWGGIKAKSNILGREAYKACYHVLSFGNGTSGALGQGNLEDCYEPERIDDLPDDVVNISAGHFHSFAITSKGELYSWGRNHEKQLGHTNNDSFSEFNPQVSDKPARVCGPIDQMNIKSVTGSGVASFAIDSEGTAWSWGTSKRGQLGLGPGVVESVIPHRLHCAPLRHIAAGWGHAVGIAESGSLYSWGYPVQGRLGYDYSEFSRQMSLDEQNDNEVSACIWLPKKVNALSGTRVRDASCGADHTIVITEWGAAFAFGDNSLNQLGVDEAYEIMEAGIGEERLAATSDVIQPVSFPCPSKALKISSGFAHSLALITHSVSIIDDMYKSDSSDNVKGVFSWGWNTANQLGHRPFEGMISRKPAFVHFFGSDSQSPTDILLEPSKIAAGRVHSAVLTEDGKVYTWGSGKNGRLGTGFDEDTAIPTEVYLPEEYSRVIDIACGYDHTLLLVE